MKNMEFDNLANQLGNNTAQEQEIIIKMRQNLINRNGGCNMYRLQNFEYHLNWDINKCDKTQLSAINKDMELQGK